MDPRVHAIHAMPDMFDIPRVSEPETPNPRATGSLRIARTVEAALLSRYMARAFLEANGRGGDPAPVLAHIRRCFSAATQSSTLADPEQMILVAGDPGDYLACAQLNFAPPVAGDIRTARPCELLHLYVDRPWWGTGLAARLLQLACAQARSHGCDAIWTQVWQQAPRAFRFLRREGFEVVGTQPTVLGEEPREEWVMLKSLRAEG